MKKVLVLLATFVLMFVSCKKDPPPAMPPAESMVMDFKAFGGGQEKSEMMKAMLADPAPGTNFTYSAGNFVFWNLVLFFNLAVPVASWYAAIGNDEWKQLDDNSWQWKFTFNGLLGTYNSRLVATNEASDVKWEMYISKTSGLGTFGEVKWYEGTTAKDGNSGHWTLNENPTNPTAYLQIDWQKTGAQVGYIKYTCVKEFNNLDDPNVYYNNYIEYGQTTNSLDRYYNIVLNDNATTISLDTVTIEWNSADTSGHVKSQHFFGDANWHCWNDSLQNITCP